MAAQRKHFDPPDTGYEPHRRPASGKAAGEVSGPAGAPVALGKDYNA